MGLDIRIIERKPLICTTCGKPVASINVHTVESNGRVWYPFLEECGYLDPSFCDIDWYGKDKVLTTDQVDSLQKFVVMNEVYNKSAVLEVVTSAICDGNNVVINADW